MSSPNIIQFVPSLKPTGPVSVALELAKLFRAKGCVVKFWYIDDLPGAVTEDAQKVNVFGKWPTTDGFHIIHAHGLRPDLMLWLHRKKLNIPVFNTIHTYIEQDFGFRYGRLVTGLATGFWQKLMTHQNAHIVLQSHMKNYYERNWQLQKLHVIPNTRVPSTTKQDENVVAKIAQLSAKNKVIISAGEAIELKGLTDIIHTLKHLPNCAWVHFGEGNLLPELKANVALQGLEHRVWLAGFVPGASAYFSLGHVFAMPSRVEGFPLALLEAVASAIPAVVSNLPVFGAVFSQNEVQQVDTQNEVVFAEAIEKALFHSSAYSTQAMARYTKDYTPEVVAEKYLRLMNKLIVNGR